MSRQVKNGVEEIEVTESSGNVFRDLGFENPEVESLRAGLSFGIHKILKKEKISTIEAGKILGIDKKSALNLVNGAYTQYRVERLMKFINLLGRDIEITIKKHPVRSKKPAGIQIADFS